jgi:hypothetical protein
VLLDGEAAGFRDGVLPLCLAFDVAAAAFLGCLLHGKSRRGLPSIAIVLRVHGRGTA